MFDLCLVSQVGQGSRSQPGQGLKLASSIPQLDGPIPDPYDDALSTPNVRMSCKTFFSCVMTSMYVIYLCISFPGRKEGMY